MKRTTLAVAALALAAGAGPAAAQNEQFFPASFYWVGPYAPGGSGFGGGMIDYFAMLNERDHGINGVKLTWEKCETEYRNDRGVECYERSKNKGPTGASVIHPLSTGITYSLIEKATADKIPVISLGYGRTDAADGRVFPYIFPLITTYWSQNTAKIGFPRDKIVGVWWSGAEEDVIPAGDAAKGYIAAGFNLPGTNFPVMQDILKNVYKKGKGEMEDSSRIGSIYHTRGVVAGIITAEAIRTAQAQFGKGKPMTGEQVRWGVEHLNIDDKRLKELGANGAGKTTTLKAISNLLRAERGEVTKGQIVFRGERIDQLDPAGLVRRGICQVMEGRHCFQHLTVEENLLTGAYSRGALGAGLREDLEKVYAYFPRLKERRHSQSGYTSGGEQQMTAIGRALME